MCEQGNDKRREKRRQLRGLFGRVAVAPLLLGTILMLFGEKANAVAHLSMTASLNSPALGLSGIFSNGYTLGAILIIILGVLWGGCTAAWLYLHFLHKQEDWERRL